MGPDFRQDDERAGTLLRAIHIDPMPRLGAWIEPHPEGIYIPAADAWIDPSTPKSRALVTHGHADHARGGHGAVLATPETLAIGAPGCGPQPGEPLGYGETIQLGDVAVQ